MNVLPIFNSFVGGGLTYLSAFVKEGYALRQGPFSRWCRPHLAALFLFWGRKKEEEKSFKVISIDIDSWRHGWDSNMEADARHARWRSLCVDAMLKRFEESSEGGRERKREEEENRKEKVEAFANCTCVGCACAPMWEKAWHNSQVRQGFCKRESRRRLWIWFCDYKQPGTSSEEKRVML